MANASEMPSLYTISRYYYLRDAVRRLQTSKNRKDISDVDEIWTESNWSTKLGVTLESNKGWYFEPIATACAVVIATLFCFLGEPTSERALTGGSMNPFSSSSSQKRSGIDLD